MPVNFLIYGSYGYTGSLIAKLAVERGFQPILAGRDEPRLRQQAHILGLRPLAFSLEDETALAAALEQVAVVVHCAGPFHRTYRRMAEACLQTRTHYLDITGEIAVFEGLARMDEAARAAGVMLLPGAGYDVVPSDCLALHLKQRLPDATHLTLAMRGLSGGISRGTALTMIDGLGRSGAVRKQGKITAVPLGVKTRQVDFGRGMVTVVNAPWGDVSTAYYSTSIPNIETYITLSRGQRRLLKLNNIASPLVSLPPVRAMLRAAIKAAPPGPTPEARQEGRSLLWGEAINAPGQRAISRLVTPEGYTLTAQAVVEIVARVLNGAARAGFQTPAGLFGADFILEFPGAQREDLPEG